MNGFGRSDKQCDDDVNPFAASRIRPGALAYQFAPGEDGRSLVARLARSRWRGEIVGPHGSGKSTLLRSLIEPLKRAGRRIELHTLQADQRRLPLDRAKTRSWASDTQVIVDGFEQLNWLRRWRLRLLCRRRQAGLLVTAHRTAGLPTLFCTTVDLATAGQIVAALVPADSGRISSQDVQRCFEKHQGNMRETLFELYDVWEASRDG